MVVVVVIVAVVVVSGSGFSLPPGAAVVGYCWGV